MNTAGKRPASVDVDVDGNDKADDEIKDARDNQENHKQQQKQQQASSAPRQPKRRRVADSARVRAARACQRCRRLKEKCDGRQPCQRCFRSGRECEFAPAGAGATVPSSRVQQQQQQQQQQPVERAEERTACLERLVQHLLGDVPLDLNNLRRMADKIGSRRRRRQGSGGDGDGWDKEDDEDEMDDLTLEDENFTVKALSQSTAHYSGEFSHWNFSQKLRRRLSQCLDADDAINRNPAKDYHHHHQRNPSATTTAASSSTRTSNRSGTRILEYWRATQLQSPKSLVQGVLQASLPPRAVANFLTHVYFRFAQVNSFCADAAWLRRRLDFLYEAPGHVTSEDSAWVCSVLTVLGIGTQFAHMAAAAGELSSTDGGGGAHDEDMADVGVSFYQMASRLVPDIITIASMESVRACLLLAHYALPLDTQGLAYTYLGLGIKMAVQNGMHRRYVGADLDAWTVETRNRLWWTAYTLERRVSVLHGRPASISPTEVDADLPKDLPEFRLHDGDDDDDDASRFANMSALIDMTLRLGDVANAITLLRRCPKNLQPTYLERIVDICQGLHTWWATLSPSVREPIPSPSSSSTFRSNAHLKLYLYLTDIFVGRPFIFTTTTSSSPSPSDNSNSNNPSRPRALADRAVDAAVAAISLLAVLDRSATGLARASYTEFSTCRAALLALLARSAVVGSPEVPDHAAAVGTGMALLRRMAANNNVSARSETSVVEALEVAVRRLHEEKGKGGGGRTGYERFREWASFHQWPQSSSGGGDDGGPTTAPQVDEGLALESAAAAAAAAVEYGSPESARWMSLVDTTGVPGVGMQQFQDDLGLFSGFPPELGALDGWSGLA